MQEPQYDKFSAPIPGQSLTDTPGKWAWEQPPQFTSFEEAADATMQRMFTNKNTKNVIMIQHTNGITTNPPIISGQIDIYKWPDRPLSIGYYMNKKSQTFSCE